MLQPDEFTAESATSAVLKGTFDRPDGTVHVTFYMWTWVKATTLEEVLQSRCFSRVGPIAPSESFISPVNCDLILVVDSAVGRYVVLYWVLNPELVLGTGLLGPEETHAMTPTAK